MAPSILLSIKKVLGVESTDESFDLDIVMHTNSVFSILNQLGIGPEEGFTIETGVTTWDAFSDDKRMISFVQSYVYLRVRMLFDPPGTSFLGDSMERNAKELEWRMSTLREGESWTDPTVPVV